jgi:heat shock 70kDa protein 1/2/6/8
MILAQLKR